MARIRTDCPDPIRLHKRNLRRYVEHYGLRLSNVLSRKYSKYPEEAAKFFEWRPVIKVFEGSLQEILYRNGSCYFFVFKKKPACLPQLGLQFSDNGKARSCGIQSQQQAEYNSTTNWYLDCKTIQPTRIIAIPASPIG